MGLVVRGWAPQAELLGHGAVGAFLTHCGWNSALEAVAGAAAAVMLAWPMQAEQFVNARLLVEGLGVAVRVAEGAAAVPDPAALARTMAEAVAEDDRGWAAEVRARAAALRRSAAEALSMLCIKPFESYGKIESSPNNLFCAKPNRPAI
uniref:Uncharacterized protein n=1 Tax=Ananas comosus var. bracteatus TaxID=296719 RepID=A0A6V7QWZ1_ANACO